MGFPGGSGGKESACNAGDLGLIPGLGRSPGGGHGSLIQYSCLENLHGQRSLVGYSPWGHKESDMTEWLSTYSIGFHYKYHLYSWLNMIILCNEAAFSHSINIIQCLYITDIKKYYIICSALYLLLLLFSG